MNLVEDKENERKGEEGMYWFCRNCGIEVKIWSRRK